jgi:hypothetical protein
MSATPGPWRHVSVDGGWDGVAEPGGAVICRLALNEPANARLMAAAPTLLEACRAAARFIANGVELGFIRLPDADTPDPAHDTLPALLAAIAKAEGR